MAIAPSRLGQLVSRQSHSFPALLKALREKRLVRARISDDQLYAVFKRARDEHAALSSGEREFNSPNERVRVFLGPFLTFKGRRWAVPLRALHMRASDDRRWWQLWP